MSIDLGLLYARAEAALSPCGLGVVLLGL